MERKTNTTTWRLSDLIRDVTARIIALETVASLDSPVAERDQVEKRVTTLVNGLVRGRIRKTNNGFGDCPHEALEFARTQFLAHIGLSPAEVAEMVQTAAGNGINLSAQIELHGRAVKVCHALAALATEVTLEAAAIYAATAEEHPNVDSRIVRDKTKPVAMARVLAALAVTGSHPELPFTEGRLLGSRSGEPLSGDQLTTVKASAGVLFEGWDEETKRRTLDRLFAVGVRHARTRGLSPFDAEDVAARAIEKCLKPGEEAKRLQTAYYVAAVNACINDLHSQRSSVRYLDDLRTDIGIHDEALSLSEQLESGLRGAAGCNKSGCRPSAEELRAHHEHHIVGDIAVEAMRKQLESRERGSVINTFRLALEAALENEEAIDLSHARALGKAAAEAIIRFGRALSGDDQSAA